MIHLYFIRHGESQFNKSVKWSGSSDTPLTENGINQAKAAGQKCKNAQIIPDIIITSPLSRAYETAKFVADEIGFPADKIIIDETTIERGFGSLEGHKELVAATRYLFDESAIDSYEGVEKVADLQARANNFLAHLKTRQEDTILVVGHGAFGRALRRSVKNEPIPKHGKLKVFANGEVITLI